jgi:ribosomal protein S18 acetylase RimI-like enzyme
MATSVWVAPPGIAETGREGKSTMSVNLRPARTGDFGYCATLYFAAMEWAIRELNLDRTAHHASFSQRWDVTQVRMITLDGADIGWLQSTTQGDALFLGQLFVDAAFQRRGIGTEVMNRLIDEAACAGQAVTLGVVKTNPALRLYQRLGFCITHDDDRKFYMRREPPNRT